MELTIEQALQRGIAAHKEGKLQEAEQLYRVILQSNPAHPDANHNLGVLAVSVNKAEAALPLFEAALKGNPKIEQFWLSYADALIKTEKFDIARQIVEQAKTQGVDEERLNLLQTELKAAAKFHESQSNDQTKALKLSEKRKKSAKRRKSKKASGQNLQAHSPSRQQVSILLEHYENGRFAEVEKLAASMTKRFPEHAFGWKALGAALKQTGRISESLYPTQKSVQLAPQDADAHSNLGNTLNDLGRLKEAEASFRKAIALKPDLAGAYSNLGITLEELGRLDDAEASYRKAIALKPDYAKAHYNLGITLQELGKLNDAEASYGKAIALKPDYAEAHSNLGNTLKELGRLDEAEASYRKAIALKPDYAEAHSNLGTTLNDLGQLEEAENSFKQALTFKPDYAEAHYNLGNTLNELGGLDDAEASYRKAVALKPDYAEAYSNLGITLKGLGRLEDAEATYRKAISLKPDFAEAHSNLGNMLKGMGRLDEAEQSYNQAIALNPDNLTIHSEWLTCLFLQEKKSVLLTELDHAINRGKTNAVVGSLTCRSALKFGIEKPNLFCKKPLDYVLHTDLSIQYDFEKVFVKKAKAILGENQISWKTQTLLVHGRQSSGNIFDIKNYSTSQIQKAIRFEIDRYRMNFKHSEEGFLKKWPTEYSLYGWLISMQSGGELQPHIHELGWLSGSIYINVPRKLGPDSGNLVVSLGREEDAVAPHINLRKTINVATGSMVLFPASLMHHTIPFEAEEERIVLAFDVKPM